MHARIDARRIRRGGRPLRVPALRQGVRRRAGREREGPLGHGGRDGRHGRRARRRAARLGRVLRARACVRMRGGDVEVRQGGAGGRCRGGARRGAEAVPVLGVDEEEQRGDEEVVDERGGDAVGLHLRRGRGQAAERRDKDIEARGRGDDGRLEDGDGGARRGGALEDALHAAPLERVRVARDAELARRVETVALEEVLLGHGRAVDEEPRARRRRRRRLPRLALGAPVGRGRGETAVAVWPVDVGDEREAVGGVAAGEGGRAAVGLGGVDGAAVGGEDGLEERRGGEAQGEEGGGDGRRGWGHGEQTRSGRRCSSRARRAQECSVLSDVGGEQRRGAWDGDRRRLLKYGRSCTEQSAGVYKSGKKRAPEGGTADPIWASWRHCAPQVHAVTPLPHRAVAASRSFSVTQHPQVTQFR